jgi:hypothetical protein
VSIKKQLEFLYNLTTNIENLDLGYIPYDWYIRIYYDESIFLFEHNNKKPWVLFIKKYLKHPRLQFIKFDCPFFKKEGHHLNLFGTIMRFHSLFKHDEDKNVKMILLNDADDVITKSYIDQIIKFQKSNYGYSAICSKYEYAFYKLENKGDCYFRSGLLATKYKLSKKMWLYIIQQLMNPTDQKLIHILESLEQKRNELIFPKQAKSFKEFDYGVDEIILNHYIRKLYKKKKIRFLPIRVKPNIINMFNIIIVYLKYNYKHQDIDNNPDFPNTSPHDRTNQLLKNILKNKYDPKELSPNIQQLINNLKTLPYNEAYHTFNMISKYIQPFKSNIKLLESLDISPTVISFIKYTNHSDYMNPVYSKLKQTLTLPNYLSDLSM